MKRILLVALAACSSHANSPKQPTGWYCGANSDGDVACARTADACAKTSTACAHADVAYCFDSSDPATNETESSCWGSATSCSTNHDYAAVTGNELTDCESTP